MAAVLFTDRHTQHGTEWTFVGVTIPKLCILCVIERLENKQELQLMVFVRKILDEFVALLNSRDTGLLNALSSSRIVMDHFCSSLLGFLCENKTNVIDLTIQVLMGLINVSNTIELQRKLLQLSIFDVLTNQNFNCSLGQLTFIGQLLHSKPNLCASVIQLHGKFLLYLIEGLTYPDESIKSSVVYILVQLCAKSTGYPLPLNIVHELCRNVPPCLTMARSTDLTVNLMGLIQDLVKVPVYSQYLFQADQAVSDSKGSTLASAFKRVLLNKDEVLQLSSVHCVTTFLIQNVEYAPVLLKADIAEYLFEILSSENDKLVSSALDCLNYLASSNEFFSGCHVIYGYEPLLYALEKAIMVKNHIAVKSGLAVINKILDRSPTGLSVLSTDTAIKQLLRIVSSCMQHTTDNTFSLCSNVLANIMKPEIISHTTQMNELIPYISLLLHHLPIVLSNNLVSQSTDTFSSLLPVLHVFYNMSQLCVHHMSQTDDVDGFDEENNLIFQFLLETCEKSLIPLSLMFDLHSEQSSTVLEHLFGILTALFQLNIQYASCLAVNLVQAGFIQLVMESRAKVMSSNRLNQFDTKANQFLEELCYHLIVDDTCDRKEVDQMKSIIHIALPNMKCSLTDSLKLLSQRVNLYTTDCQPLNKACQSTVLCLCYLENIYRNIPVSTDIMFDALTTYLSLNTEIHLLPMMTLRHFITLYCACYVALTACDAIQHERLLRGKDILIRCLLRLPDPSIVFSHQITLLQWSYSQPLLRHSITKQWLQKWLSHPVSTDHLKLTALLREKSFLAEDIFGILVCGGLDCITNAVALLETLLHNDSGEIHVLVLKKVELTFLSQRLEPIPDDNMAALLTVLNSIQFGTNIKLFCQVISIVSSTNVDSDSSSFVMTQGLKVICKGLEHSQMKSQISNMLYNNFALLDKMVSFVNTSLSSNKAKCFSTILEFITLLMGRKDTSSNPFDILFIVLLKSLMCSDITVRLQTLKFWNVVFICDGNTHPFRIVYGCDYNNTHKKSLQLLAFLLINIISKDQSLLVENACICLISLLQHIGRNKETITFGELISDEWILILAQYFSVLFHEEVIPLQYQLLINEIICHTQGRKVSQSLQQLLQDKIN